MKIRSFAAWLPVGSDSALTARFEDTTQGLREWRSGSLRVHYAPRAAAPDAPSGERLPTLILGDDSEFESTRELENLASGVPIRCDGSGQTLVLSTSLVALPPIFLYRGQRTVALTSDLHLLRGIPGVRLELDPAGVVELGHFGHPVGHRTLFRDVELVAAGSRLTFGARRDITVSRTWQLPERAPVEWQQFIEAQIAAFTSQVNRIDVSGSFLSLTAGLDTRTVFASLAREQRLVRAATMTGPRRSLDARIAGRLCRAYGVRHDAVTFDEHFLRQLPGYVEMASLLSGGQASLGQAPEIHLYAQLGGGCTARLSGNLGNQVGRGGTEGISVRNASIDVLAPRLRAPGPPRGHWLLEQLDRDERATLHFILHSEIPFTLVGNFNIGNHFAAQQTPYASRSLIETLASRPVNAGVPSGSKLRMRLRDLRHRFLGEPERHSFQRTLVKRIGGFAAECPVNWGWRPAGGVSPTGLVFGGATLLGMLARATGLDGGPLRRPLELSGLPALHDFRESRRWLRTELRQFTMDVLGSADVRTAELFEWNLLAPMLDDHFQGRRDHYESVTFALDVALAQRIFCR